MSVWDNFKVEVVIIVEVHWGWQTFNMHACAQEGGFPADKRSEQLTCADELPHLKNKMHDKVWHNIFMIYRPFPYFCTFVHFIFQLIRTSSLLASFCSMESPFLCACVHIKRLSSPVNFYDDDHLNLKIVPNRHQTTDFIEIKSWID